MELSKELQGLQNLLNKKFITKKEFQKFRKLITEKYEQSLATPVQAPLPQVTHDKIRLSSRESSMKAIEDLIKFVAPYHVPYKVDEKKVEEYQKQTLGSFYKGPLSHGRNAKEINLSILGKVLDREPTCCIGDKKKFSEYVQEDACSSAKHYLITMVSRSGSGKTASVIALTEKHFVIYALCAYRYSGCVDFGDPNFVRLASDVEEMSMELEKEFDRKTIKSLVNYDNALKMKAGDRVELEFLARHLFLLFLFEQDPQLKPETFFREQINGDGSIIIEALVRELKQYHSDTIRDMLGIVFSKLKKHLNGRGLVVALDEAHIAEDRILHGKLISEKAIKYYHDTCKGKPKADFFDTYKNVYGQYRRGFLAPLCAALRNLQVTLVVLGTKFSLLNADHVYPASSKPDSTHIRLTNFPSADEKDVGDILNSLLDLTDCVIPPETQLRLVGRFRFTTYIIHAISQVDSRETKTKQDILNEAILLAERKAINDARADVMELLKHGKEHLLRRILIAFRLKDGHISFSQDNDTDLVDSSLCVLAEENEKKYSYSLKEPLVAEAVRDVLKKQGIDTEFSEYFDQLDNTFQTYGISSSGKGEIFERLIGEFLKRFNGYTIANLPFVKNNTKDIVLPDWCNRVKLQVDKIKSSNILEDDLEYFRNPPVNEGRYPHHETRPDFMQNLTRVRSRKKKWKYYGMAWGAKFGIYPVSFDTNKSNTTSTNLRLCFMGTDGKPNPKIAHYREAFENSGYLEKISGILRIHFVFPGVEKGTPKSCVEGQDVLIYIDMNNMNSFFYEDDSLSGNGHVQNMKRMISYMMNSQEKLEELKMKGCKCKEIDCNKGKCTCYNNGEGCSEWCHPKRPKNECKNPYIRAALPPLV